MALHTEVQSKLLVVFQEARNRPNIRLFLLKLAFVRPVLYHYSHTIFYFVFCNGTLLQQ